MRDGIATVAPNPHALPAALGAASGHGAGFVLQSAATAEGRMGVWPLRLGRAWPGLGAALSPRDAAYDLNGGPFLDDAAAGELAALMVERWPRAWPRVVAAKAVIAEGPAWAALQAMHERGRIALHPIARWERALFERGAAPDAESYLKAALSGEQRKRLRRKRRALEAEAGAVTFKIAAAPDAVALALDDFCRLEQAGWKGRAGSALAQDPGGRRYVADVLAGLAESGGAFAAVLRAGEEPVAAGLFLRAGGEAVFWKTAYDERRSRHSPGVLLDLALTEWLYDQSWFERLDAGHDDSVDPGQLIWRERRAMADVVIDLDPPSLRGRLVAGGLRLRQALRLTKRRLQRK